MGLREDALRRSGMPLPARAAKTGAENLSLRFGILNQRGG
jgi:hypothetical protein